MGSMKRLRIVFLLVIAVVLFGRTERILAYGEKGIVSVKEVTINIYENQRVNFPEKVDVILSDGTTEKVSIKWKDKNINTNKPGAYIVEGQIKGYLNNALCYINIKSFDEIINDLIILPDSEYDRIEAKKIEDRLSGISDKILEELLAKGIRVKLITTNVTDVPEYVYLRGIVPRGWEGTGKTWDDVPGISGNPVAIRIGYSNSGNGHASVNLELHETAHTIDSYVLNGISNSDSFKAIWEQEVGSIFPNNSYYRSFSSEYFAEVFAMFYLDGEHKYDLSLKAPLTFKFIEGLVPGS
jgi:hypothetical protein